MGMNYKTIANVLGKLLIVTGSSLMFPIICSLYYGEDDLFSLAMTAAITIGVGYLLWRWFKNFDDLNLKDGFFIAFFGWILISFFFRPPVCHSWRHSLCYRCLF